MMLLGLVPLALAGCEHREDDEKDGHGGCRRGGGQGQSYGCEVGVSFVLTGIQDRLDRASPVTVRACFDQSCDELTLTLSGREPRCEGAPGGPPDQLTGCNLHSDGTLSVDILRVDSQDYSNGQPHTAAITFLDAEDKRLYSHAEVVSYSDTTCELTEIRLAQR